MRIRPLVGASLLLAGGLFLTSATPASGYVRPSEITRVNVDSAENQATYADPLLPTGGHGCYGLHELDITPNGRFVAFVSSANNLVPDDTNGICDIFVRDQKKGITERVSVGSNGQEALGAEGVSVFYSSTPTISANGRYVAFESTAPNLVTPASDPPAVDANTNPDVFLRDRRTGKTALLSLAKEIIPGEPRRSASRGSSSPSISLDGKYVVFRSLADDLVDPTAVQLAADYAIYVHEIKTHTTTFIAPGQLQPSISGDGRFVDFVTTEQLVEKDINVNDDVYVYDRQTEKFELISVTVSGSSTNLHLQGGTGAGPVVVEDGSNLSFDGGTRQISADGRYVVFESPSFELVPNDTNGVFIMNGNDIFVRDRKANRTERVSVSSVGHEAWHTSNVAAISPDGRYITFASHAQNLAEEKCCGDSTVAGDPDVFVYDRISGQQEIVSVKTDGTEAPCENPSPNAIKESSTSNPGTLSADGRFVTFSSCAVGLVANDTNGDDQWDMFVRERGATVDTGGTEATRAAPALGSWVDLAGSESFSTLGYAISSDAASDAVSVTHDTDLIGARLAFRPELHDLFAVIDLAGMPAIAELPRLDLLYGMRFEIGAVTYEVRAQRTPFALLLPGGAQFGLFRCTGEVLGCTHVADLEGGYGTLGQSIAVSIPLDAVGLQDGGSIDAVTGFSALGSYLSGPVQTLDTVDVR